MRAAIVLAVILSTAGIAEAQCDASHVETDGHCCRAGQVVIDGRCAPSPPPPATWELRGSFIGSGIALLLGGYLTAISGFLGFGLNADATACAAPGACRSAYGVWSLVPFLHLVALANDYPAGVATWFGTSFGFGTAAEILGVVLFVFGLVGRPTRDATRVAPQIGPGLTGMSITTSF